MNLDATAAKYTLLAEARQEWVSDHQRKALTGGEAVGPVPSDSELIADEPPLMQEIAALEAQQTVIESPSASDTSPAAATNAYKTGEEAAGASGNGTTDPNSKGASYASDKELNVLV